MFNEVYWAIINYNGPMPDELKAPKPGSLYTIRPAVDEKTENALLVHVDANDENYSTKEVYNADAIRDDKSYDSRAAWLFEGTPDGDFLALSGLKVKNIHTQCYFAALTGGVPMVNENTDTTVTLKPLGACTTMFKVGELCMDLNETIFSYDRNADNFWGEKLTSYPSEIGHIVVHANGNVHKKSVAVHVVKERDVTVTFKYIEGHQLNIIGVDLVDGDEVKYRDYGNTLVKGDSSPIYTLKDVKPGVYTLNCYAFDFNQSDKLDQHKGYFEVCGVAKINNAGDETTPWIVEEIQNPEKSVYYETSTNLNGHSTLMLGFPAKIPSEVEAFYGSTHGKLLDGRYLSMTSYDGGILPANTPVVLRNKSFDASNPVSIKGLKFYYSATTVDAVEDNYLYGSLYWTLVECASFDEKDVDGDGKAEGNVNIYMLQASKQDVKMFWVYENYREDGTKTGDNDDGGYVLCKANKAYMVLPSDKVGTISTLSFRFDGNTPEIDEVEYETVKTIYDLQGRKLDTITAPGIYIVNGVKVLVK